MQEEERRKACKFALTQIDDKVKTNVVVGKRCGRKRRGVGGKSRTQCKRKS